MEDSLAMPDGKWSAGSLRIASRTMSVGDISEMLGIEPDRSYERGSLISPRDPDSRRWDSTVWIRTSGLANDRWLDEHLAVLVRLLDGRQEALGRLAGDCEVDLFLGFGSESQGGCVLPAALLKEIGLLGIDVVLDLYPPSPDDAEEDYLFSPSSAPAPHSDPPHPPTDPSAPPAH